MRHVILISLICGLCIPANGLTWNFRRDYYLPTDEYNEEAIMRGYPTEGGRLQLISQGRLSVELLLKIPMYCIHNMPIHPFSALLSLVLVLQQFFDFIHIISIDYFM